jgi:hypothetical protein
MTYKRRLRKISLGAQLVRHAMPALSFLIRGLSGAALAVLGACAPASVVTAPAGLAVGYGDVDSGIRPPRTACDGLGVSSAGLTIAGTRRSAALLLGIVAVDLDRPPEPARAACLARARSR